MDQANTVGSASRFCGKVPAKIVLSCIVFALQLNVLVSNAFMTKTVSCLSATELRSLGVVRVFPHIVSELFVAVVCSGPVLEISISNGLCKNVLCRHVWGSSVAAG